MTFSEAKLEYWKAVDWTKPRLQLMTETGCSIHTLSKWYAKLKGAELPHSSKHKETLSALDWAKTDAELFRETRIAPNTIRHYRFTNGKGMPTQRPHPHTKVLPEQLSSVDWQRETDNRLAGRWGISRERVRQLRITHNKPACKFPHLSAGALAVAQWLDQNRTTLEGKHIHEITRAVPSPLPTGTIRSLVNRLGITYQSNRAWKHSPLGQHPLNYELPNVVLALVWGVSLHSVANTRSALKIGPPKWYVGGFFSRFWEKADFQEALEAELKKAEQHGKTNARAAIEEYLASKRRMAVRRMQPEEPLAPYP